MEKDTKNSVETEQNDSFAMELLRGYKKQFYVVVTILSVIIIGLFGYIMYDKYIDSLYETVNYSQDGNGNNVIGDNNEAIYGTENAGTPAP